MLQKRGPVSHADLVKHALDMREHGAIGRLVGWIMAQHRAATARITT